MKCPRNNFYFQDADAQLCIEVVNFTAKWTVAYCRVCKDTGPFGILLCALVDGNSAFPMLGKRKREIAVAPRRRPRISTGDEDSNPTTSADASHDVFRKYFESAFEPLPDSKTAASLHSEGDDGSGSEGAGASPAGDEDNNSMSEESAWEGLSDTDQQDAEVVVVEHNSIAQDLQDLESHKEQYKTFMVSDAARRTARY